MNSRYADPHEKLPRSTRNLVVGQIHQSRRRSLWMERGGLTRKPRTYGPWFLAAKVMMTRAPTIAIPAPMRSVDLGR